MSSRPDPKRPQGGPAGKETNWRGWGIGALAALVLIVALQNSQEVRVDVLFLNVTAPLIVILLVAVAVGAVIGYAAPVLRRHRRDQRQVAAKN